MACLDENTAQSFASGQMEASAYERVVQHLVSCHACQRLVVLGRAGRPVSRSVADPSVTVSLEGGAAPAPRARRDEEASTEVSELERGTIIGRYTILELVGVGGVGEVYAAYDPKLDRRVALKLLRTERIAPGDSGEARLLREAQAIAKVSHPNVVTIHDVGTHGDRVFLAMEFIDGATVKDWLAAGPRTRRQILAVFENAARGLVAAHAAGLVHRDFKPQNVMVPSDGGAARVMDFGLVRQMGQSGETGTTEGDASAGGPADGDVDLTRTGDLVGTPRYMAPEQFKAERIDARTDQFSFCVSLYEALYGQRPFEGDVLPTLITNVLAGRIAPPPAKAGVPGWLRRVVLRGLENDPGRRFPSMAAILTALEDDPTARRRRFALGLGLGVCALLGVAGLWRFATPPRVDCGGGLERWNKTWTPTATPGAETGRRQAIHAAFAATGKSYAERAFTSAAASLDAYARSWVGIYEDACLAHAHGAQSSEMLDLRMSCLQDRLTAAGALTELFTRADGQIVENALLATSSLPRLERCANVALLKAVVPPPEGEGLRARVEALRAEVAHLAALRTAGHCQEGALIAGDLIARVRAAGYQPLVADTLNEAALLGDNCAELALSKGRAEEAYVAAVASRHDEAAALAAIDIAVFHTDREHQIATGRTWLEIARASLQRFADHPLLDAWFANLEGAQAIAEGRGQDALEAIRRSQALRVKILGAENPDPVIHTLNIGAALDLAGRGEEAIASFEETAAHAARVLGPGHPAIALAFNNEGEALDHLRRYAEALPKFARATEIWRDAGSDPLFLSFSLTGTGLSLLGERRPEEAIAPLEQALASRVAKGGGVDRVNETRTLLARALWSHPAEHARALSLAEQARVEYDAADAKDKAKSVAAWLAAPTSAL